MKNSQRFYSPEKGSWKASQKGSKFLNSPTQEKGSEMTYSQETWCPLEMEAEEVSQVEEQSDPLEEPTHVAQDPGAWILPGESVF